MRTNLIHATGFKSPTEAYAEAGIDWLRLIFPKPHAMYPMAISGSSLSEFGILDGDLVIIDCSKRPENDQIIVAAIEGEFVLGKFQAFPPILYSGTESIPLSGEARIVGVVSRMIRIYP